MRDLTLWESYTRGEVHEIFEPDTTFTAQTGKWGLPGIVRLSENDGDYVFFVTFGTSAVGHDFVEDITADGVLTWQSQPSQRLKTPTIERFIVHNDLTNSIHLFLRTKSTIPYTYFGKLGYLDHDPTREAPVYFTWQLMDWPAPPAVVSDLQVVLSDPAEPTTPFAPAQGGLTMTDPPTVAAGAGGVGSSSGGGKKATLPGQDARNAKLGLAGEKLVLKHERQRLEEAGRPDLAQSLVHVAVVEGDSAGYDIRSFNVDGTHRHIEVKTTRGPASNAFFVSPNEITFSTGHPDSYVLLRVYGYSYDTDSANYYELLGSVAEWFRLTPSEFRARLLPTANS